jgi:hypothetical protein
MKLGILALVLVAGYSYADCVLQDKTVSQSSAVIAERTQITATVVPDPQLGKRCLVTFRARVGASWYTANGEYAWPGDTPRDSGVARRPPPHGDKVRD